jgi:hypothetical protein
MGTPTTVYEKTAKKEFVYYDNSDGTRTKYTKSTSVTGLVRLDKTKPSIK